MVSVTMLDKYINCPEPVKLMLIAVFFSTICIPGKGQGLTCHHANMAFYMSIL